MKPPSIGFLKLIMDGAMLSNLHKIGVEAILRDEKLDIVMAASKVENEVANPKDIELLTIFKGLQLCADMGIQKLIIDSDCLLVIQEFQNAAALLSKVI